MFRQSVIKSIQVASTALTKEGTARVGGSLGLDCIDLTEVTSLTGCCSINTELVMTLIYKGPFHFSSQLAVAQFRPVKEQDIKSASDPSCEDGRRIPTCLDAVLSACQLVTELHALLCNQ